MSAIPPNLSRVPTHYASTLALANISRNNLSLLKVQEMISTGRAVNRVSDDIVKASAIGVLDDRLERSDQVQRNLQHAQSSLNVLDSTLDEATSLAREAQSLASEQVSLTSSASERLSQATVVDQMLHAVFNIANRGSVAGYVLGGTITSKAPVEQFLGYFRYRGENNAGLTTDLGQASTVPITLGPTHITGLSTRIRNTLDMDPQLTASTRLVDLHGARGLGILTGPVEFSVNGSDKLRVELGGADSVQEVINRITNAVRAYETDSGTTVLGPGGISVSGEGLSIDIAAGQSLQFFEVGTSVTGQDLGLVTTPASTFGAGVNVAGSLGVKLTMQTPLTALNGITLPLGSIRLSNAGHTQVVDLSGAQTVEDLKNLIEGTNLGVRVSINEAGTAIDVINEVSAGSQHALSISEVAGNNATAQRLGIRSFSLETRISDFNDGKGVQIVDAVRDPITGAPNASLNTDMLITLGNGAATPITIDFTPSDMTSVESVLVAMNSQIQTQLAAAGLPATALVASLAADGNGIALTQDASFPNAISVLPQNNSPSVEQLGLLNGTWDTASATFTGEDRAKVRVDSVFSDLVDLRESLRTNNVRGISLAGQSLNDTIDSVVEVRGMVGGFAQRVDAALSRESDRATLDETTRSQLRDTDFTSAASRFSLLQTQLEASLRTTAVTQQLSLLDFLG